MSLSRRKRKRERGRNHGSRGDRSYPLLGGWGEASRGELRLLRHAIRRGWPVPTENRGPLLEKVFPLINAGNPRLTIAVALVMIEADRANVRAESSRIREEAARLRTDIKLSRSRR